MSTTGVGRWRLKKSFTSKLAGVPTVPVKENPEFLTAPRLLTAFKKFKNCERPETIVAQRLVQEVQLFSLQI